MTELKLNKKKNQSFGMMMMNPIIAKISKVEEHSSESAVTYKGIANKLFYFILMTLVGVAVPHLLAFAPIEKIVLNENIQFNLIQVGGILVGLLFTLFVPLLIFKFRKAAPVLGSLYCITSGYTVGFFIIVSGKEYLWAASLALILTIAVVGVMTVIYTRGIIKVTEKFKVVVATLFGASILSGLFLFIAHFIPGLKNVALAVSQSQVLGIVSSIIFIVVAALFLLVDFDEIKRCVEQKLPKEYEWVTAFALVFTIIWLYFKILNLILKLKSNN